MDVAIITSSECPAGRNVHEQLLKLFSFEAAGEYDNSYYYELQDSSSAIRLYTINTLHIFAEELDKSIDADVFVFATTHRSRAGIPSLAVHAPGNWGKAELGGKDGLLGIAPAAMIKKGLQLLSEKVAAETLQFEVIQEATHHGPYLQKPAMFIEIGSSAKEYGNQEAGKVVAATILEMIGGSGNSMASAVGIGGLHHTPNFRGIQMKTDIAVGHVCPKYVLEHLTTEKLQQAMEKTWPRKADLVLVDWKGLGGQKERVKKVLGSAGVPWEKVKEVKDSGSKQQQ